MEPKFRDAQKVYFIDCEWVVEAYYLYGEGESARICWDIITNSMPQNNLFLTREDAKAEIKRRIKDARESTENK